MLYSARLKGRGGADWFREPCQGRLIGSDVARPANQLLSVLSSGVSGPRSSARLHAAPAGRSRASPGSIAVFCVNVISCVGSTVEDMSAGLVLQPGNVVE